jgi:hypothetical protein
MRLASLLLFAILLSCLSYQTCAIEPGEIAAPSIKAPNMNMPKPIISSPNMDTPEPKQRKQIIPEGNPNQSTNQTQVMKAESNDLSGKWSITFDDRPDRLLDLTLWSSGRTQIMGYGTLTRGVTGNSVTASGSFAESELVLTVKSAESDYASQKYDEYDLHLIMVNNTARNTMSGTYILRSGGEFLGDGNATALKR